MHPEDYDYFLRRHGFHIVDLALASELQARYAPDTPAILDDSMYVLTAERIGDLTPSPRPTAPRAAARYRFSMARSIWSGSVSFGLISIPVKLYTAVRDKGVSFNQLDDRTMARIKYQKVSEETGEEVPSEHIVKGFEISKGRYVRIDPEELEPFVPSSTKTIEVEEFVDLDQIDPVYFETSYYVAPHLNPKPYVLLARAMEAAGRVAIVRFVMRSRQYTAAILPSRTGW